MDFNAKDVKLKEIRTKGLRKFKIVDWITHNVVQLDYYGETYYAMITDGVVQGEYFISDKGKIYVLRDDVEAGLSREEQATRFLQLFREKGYRSEVIKDFNITQQSVETETASYPISRTIIGNNNAIIREEKEKLFENKDVKDISKAFSLESAFEEKFVDYETIAGQKYGVTESGVKVPLNTGDENTNTKSIGPVVKGEDVEAEEAREEEVVMFFPLWLGPIIFNNGRKLGSAIRKNIEMYGLEEDDMWYEIKTGPYKGYPFAERIMTFPTEEDKIFADGFRALYRTGMPYAEDMLPASYAENDIYKPLSGQFENTIDTPNGNIDLISRLDRVNGNVVWHEGISAWEYFLKITNVSPDRGERYRLLYLSGTSLYQFGEAGENTATTIPSRRIVLYEPETGKYHTTNLFFMGWMQEARNLQDIWDPSGSRIMGLSNTMAKLHGGFVISDVTIDVTNMEATLNGEMLWLDTPIEKNLYDLILYKYDGYVSAYSKPTVTYINDNLPDGNIVLINDKNEVVHQQPITATEYKNNSQVLSGKKENDDVIEELMSIGLLKSVENDVYANTEETTELNIQFPKHSFSVGLGINRYRPAYCIDIPSNFAPLKNADGNLWHIRYGDITAKNIDEAWHIPHMELKVVGEEKYNRVQSPFPPGTNISEKPSLTQIQLTKSAVPLPKEYYPAESYEKKWSFSFKSGDLLGGPAYPNYGLELSPSRFFHFTKNYISMSQLLTTKKIGFATPKDGITYQKLTTPTTWNNFMDVLCSQFTYNESDGKVFHKNQVIDAWVLNNGNIEDFFDSTGNMRFEEFKESRTINTFYFKDGTYPNTGISSSEPRPAVPQYWYIMPYPPREYFQDAENVSKEYDNYAVWNIDGTVTLIWKYWDTVYHTRTVSDWEFDSEYPFIRVPAQSDDWQAIEGEWRIFNECEMNIEEIKAEVAYRIGALYDIYWKTGNIDTAIKYGWRPKVQGAGYSNFSSYADSPDYLVPIPVFGTDRTTTYPDPNPTYRYDTDPILSVKRFDLPTWGLPTDVSGFITNTNTGNNTATYGEKILNIGDVITRDYWFVPIEMSSGIDVHIEDSEISEDHTVECVFNNTYELHEGVKIFTGKPAFVHMYFTIPILEVPKLMVSHEFNAHLINPNKIPLEVTERYTY